MKFNKILLAIFIFSVVLSCSNSDSDENNKEKEEVYILQLKNEIEKMAASSICNEEFECKYVAFGSKPCGGPWSYLLYNTSIDETYFLKKVTELNTKEKEYNVLYGIISDCSTPAPPSTVECINGVCTALY